MKMLSKALPLIAATALVGACTTDTTRDGGVDSGPLSLLQAGIWIDPNGCDHWIIDDGVEGYMTPRGQAGWNTRLPG